MRILIINSEYPPIGGGAGNASGNLAVELTAQGQDVTVLTVRFDDLPEIQEHKGVRVWRIKSLRRKKERSGAFEQGVFGLTGSLAMFSLLRKWRPDAIIAFFGVPSGAVAWLTGGLTHIPYLVSLRGGDVPGFRPYDFAFYHRLIAPVLHWVWRRAGSVVANSQGLADMASTFDSQVKIEVIPNGVDTTRYRVAENRNWEFPRMLWAGRLVYQKGLDILVEALGDLKNLPWELTIIGDGSYRAALEQQAHQMGIADRIVITGWLDRKEMDRFYQQANLFVFPSRHEGMPNAILEAMACGLPVIASHIAGNEELVLPDETGLLVPPQDAKAFRQALRILLTDPEKRKRMGLAARQRVEAHYTWEQIAHQYLVLLQRMVG